MKRDGKTSMEKRVVVTRGHKGARVVEYQVGEFSGGFIVVDAPSDLYLLRDGIEEYIRANGIKHPSGK